MTIEAYLTSDIVYGDEPMVTVKSYGIHWTIDICPHCDGVGILGYRQSAGGVVEDTCSACKGRGVLVDDDGIPF